jgi:hypothetical protein
VTRTSRTPWTAAPSGLLHGHCTWRSLVMEEEALQGPHPSMPHSKSWLAATFIFRLETKLHKISDFYFLLHKTAQLCRFIFRSLSSAQSRPPNPPPLPTPWASSWYISLCSLSCPACLPAINYPEMLLLFTCVQQFVCVCV